MAAVSSRGTAFGTVNEFHTLLYATSDLDTELETVGCYWPELNRLKNFIAGNRGGTCPIAGDAELHAGRVDPRVRKYRYWRVGSMQFE